MSQGKIKPETVSVRIREDDYAVIRDISNDHGVKVVDVVQSLVDVWHWLDEDEQRAAITGEEPPEEESVIFKSEPGDHFAVTYKKTPPSSD